MDKQEPVIIHALPFSIKHELKKQAENAFSILQFNSLSPQMTLVYVAVKADDDSRVYCGMGVRGSEDPTANLVVVFNCRAGMITAYSKKSWPGLLVTDAVNKTQYIVKND